jgi:hypothetical protein
MNDRRGIGGCKAKTRAFEKELWQLESPPSATLALSSNHQHQDVHSSPLMPSAHRIPDVLVTLSLRHVQLGRPTCPSPCPSQNWTIFHTLWSSCVRLQTQKEMPSGHVPIDSTKHSHLYGGLNVELSRPRTRRSGAPFLVR